MSSRTARHRSGWRTLENPTAWTVGCRMLNDHVAGSDQPLLPAPSTALSAAEHFTECSPTPLTGTRADDPGSHCAGPPSTAHERPAIPDGLPPAPTVTY